MPKAPADFIVNDPAIGWGAKLKPKADNSHKYDHGHVVVLGSRKLTGAGCLAALSALRMGAGLCTVAAPSETSIIYRMASPSLMVEPCEEIARFKDHLHDARRNVAIVGPGAGLDNIGGLKKAVLDCVQANPKKICVLDADALTVFADNVEVLRRVTHENCVLTPHEGEFARLFPEYIEGSRLERAQAAATKSNAIIVLKGHETVIASPQGGCVVNQTGTGWLATAGSGDVLAGMIAGLAARNLQDLSLFGAVCAAVWLHGEAASRFGAGLISEDIPAQLPDLMAEMLTRKYATKAAPKTAAKKKKAA
jgi:NAD(P)H-hydrate epimerase